MVSNNSNEKEVEEITNWFKVISQVNLKSLSEMARIGKLAQEVLSHQTQIQWQLARRMQLSVIRHLQEIDMATTSKVLRDMRKLERASLMKAIKASTFAYRNYLESIQRIHKESLQREIIETSRVLSLAYANTILAYRSLIEPKPKAKIRISEEQNQIQKNVDQDIDSLLKKLNPDFVTMRVGAWTTFNAKSPDHLRQSITSMRELFNHVLRSLSPGGATRKDRIRAIMSGNGRKTAEADFIELVAESVDKLYPVLSKITHTVYKDELCVEMVLKAAEAVLVVLLKKGITYT